ncbi:unnamed protein product [Closterium sp. NIES-65]|nr:unnamed protein product [Closterium sp. NIES-65]
MQAAFRLVRMIEESHIVPDAALQTILFRVHLQAGNEAEALKLANLFYGPQARPYIDQFVELFFNHGFYLMRKQGSLLLQEALTSDVSVACSDVSVACSDVSVACSDVSVACSDVSVACSDVSVACSDVSVACSDVSVACSDVSVACSDVSVACSDVSVACSDVSVACSDVSVACSDVSVACSDVSVACSDVSVACSDVSVACSDVSVACSDVSVACSDVSVACSDVSVACSDVSVACSDVSVACSDVSTVICVRSYGCPYGCGAMCKRGGLLLQEALISDRRSMAAAERLFDHVVAKHQAPEFDAVLDFMRALRRRQTPKTDQRWLLVQDLIKRRRNIRGMWMKGMQAEGREHESRLSVEEDEV